MNMDLLEKNLDILREYNQPMVDIIENSKVPEDVTCDNNNFYIKFKSITIPAYESMNKMKPVLKDVLKNVSLDRGQITVIVGAGYGHMFYEILKNKKKHHLVLLIEPNTYFIKETLSRYNITKWMKDHTLFIVTSIDDIGMAINTIETFHVLTYWSLLVDPYTSNLPLIYSDAVQKANEHINSVQCNTGTVMGAGKLMAQNDVECLPYVIRNRGVNELTDIFKGKPAVLVSTGPSLLKNIWRLKEYQDKIIIVSVAQALRTLLAYDIRPDFITTVDYGDINYSHFEGLMDCDVPLICLNRTYAPILKQYKGTKFISGSHQPGFEDTTIGILEGKGWLDSGGSVAHFNMSASIIMGCDPLIFIGQDLSWTDKTHADTLDESGKVTIDNGLLFWEVTDPRSKLKKSKKMCIGQAMYVPGYYGNNVLTNVGLASFITSFESMIKGLDKTVINSTEGGVHLQGTERMSLKDSLEKYSKGKIDKSILEPLNTLSPDADNLIEEAIKRLKSDIELCDSIMKDGKTALDSCFDMEKLANQKRYSESKMKEIMDTNKTYSDKTEEAAKQCPLVAISILKTSRDLHSNEMYVEKTKVKHLLDDRTGLKTRIKRNKLILEAARKSAKEVKSWCKKSLDILEQYNKTKDESLLIEDSGYVPSLKDAEKFFAIGNWATPLIEARNYIRVSHPLSKDVLESHNIINNAEKMREEIIMKWKKEPDMSLQIQYQSLMDKAREIGMKGEGHKLAEPIKQEARELELYLEYINGDEGDNYDNFDKLIRAFTYKDVKERLNNYFTENKKLIEDEIIDEINSLTIDELHTKYFNLQRDEINKRYKLFESLSKSEINKIKVLHEKADKYILSDFKTSLELLEKARKLLPKEFPARWGIANALTIIKKTKQAVKEYESLLKDFPENIDIQFEYGCALLDVDTNKGVTKMIEVMQKTDKYDHMFIHIGNIYRKSEEYDKAISAYEKYLDKYPQDPNAKNLLEECKALLK